MWSASSRSTTPTGRRSRRPRGRAGAAARTQAARPAGRARASTPTPAPRSPPSAANSRSSPGPLDPDDVVRFLGECANDLGLEASVNPPVFPLQGGEDGDAPGPRDLIGSEARQDAASRRCGRRRRQSAVAAGARGVRVDRGRPHGHLGRRAAVPRAADLPAGRRAERLGQRRHRTGRNRRLRRRARQPRGALLPASPAHRPAHGRLRAFPPSGAVAGVIARTDGERGVWKAPAGTEARLAGVRSLTAALTDRETGAAQPARRQLSAHLPGARPVVWGARTLEGADPLDSEWKYVPVRRLALHARRASTAVCSGWSVRAQRREPVAADPARRLLATCNTLFRQGALQGRHPARGVLRQVPTATTTTTGGHRERQIVNVLVGIAPVRPAEFVIVKIQQTSGQFALEARGIVEN